VSSRLVRSKSETCKQERAPLEIRFSYCLGDSINWLVVETKGSELFGYGTSSNLYNHDRDAAFLNILPVVGFGFCDHSISQPTLKEGRRPPLPAQRITRLCRPPLPSVHLLYMACWYTEPISDLSYVDDKARIVMAVVVKGMTGDRDGIDGNNNRPPLEH
jgi:hypothetical protein